MLLRKLVIAGVMFGFLAIPAADFATAASANGPEQVASAAADGAKAKAKGKKKKGKKGKKKGKKGKKKKAANAQ
ncbi:MAG: hypothetical protein K2R98_10465 [Gemmataceae bacterium]|nr:hypothetical protein [Gemmataceae bacterium]